MPCVADVRARSLSFPIHRFESRYPVSNLFLSDNCSLPDGRVRSTRHNSINPGNNVGIVGATTRIAVRTTSTTVNVWHTAKDPISPKIFFEWIYVRNQIPRLRFFQLRIRLTDVKLGMEAGNDIKTLWKTYTPCGTCGKLCAPRTSHRGCSFA